jgi:hypothetical protein
MDEMRSWHWHGEMGQGLKPTLTSTTAVHLTGPPRAFITRVAPQNSTEQVQYYRPIALLECQGGQAPAKVVGSSHLYNLNAYNLISTVTKSKHPAPCWMSVCYVRVAWPNERAEELSFSLSVASLIILVTTI